MPQGKRRFWSAEELETVRLLYPHQRTDKIAAQLGCSVSSAYQVAAKLGLHKTPAYLASPDACRLRRGDNVGAASRYKPGRVPENKGLRRPGWAPGRMADNQFKPGQLTHNHVPIGFERVNADGYRDRKVAEPRTWKSVHVLLWEEANGPVPAGYAVIFKDGDKANIVLENLECISRRDLMLRNSSQRWGPEVFGLIQLRGALNRKIRKLNAK